MNQALALLVRETRGKIIVMPIHATENGVVMGSIPFEALITTYTELICQAMVEQYEKRVVFVKGDKNGNKRGRRKDDGDFAVTI